MKEDKEQIITFTGSQNIERCREYIKVENKKISEIKETLNLKIDFKATFDPDMKLSEIRASLISSIDSFMFQDYKNSYIPKSKEHGLSLRDCLLKPKNQKLIAKVKTRDLNIVNDKDFNSSSFKFQFLDTKNINLSDRTQLGEGGFGHVYHAKYKSFQVAVKTMKIFNKEKFMKEALITHYLRSIRSLCIIGLEKFSQKAPNVGSSTTLPINYNMILEFVPGESLKEIIKNMNINLVKQPKNELLMIVYALDLAKGIEFLAKRKIIHRDLKPDNCMLNKSFDLFIIDFGIAKEQKHDQTHTAETGTLLYFPPENCQDTDESEKDKLKTENSISARKRKISSAFDMWCFGLIISEMFGCEPPWGNKATSVIVEHSKKTKYPIPRNIDLDIIKLLIENCTKFHPEERITISNAIKVLITLLQERLEFHSIDQSIDTLFETNSKNLMFVNKIKTLFDSCDKSTLNLDDGYLNVGNLLLNHGDIRNAEIYFNKAHEYNTDACLMDKDKKTAKPNSVIYNCLGRIAEIKGDYVEAKKHYERSIEISASNDIAYNLLGNLLINVGAYDKANNYLQLAKQIDTKNYKTLILLGKLQERLEKEKEAEKFYTAANDLAKNKPEPKIRLGYLCEKQGRILEASKFYHELLKVDRYSEVTYICNSNFFMTVSKDLDKAEQLEKYLLSTYKDDWKEAREAHIKNKKPYNVDEPDENTVKLPILALNSYNESISVNNNSDDMIQTCINYLEYDDVSDGNAKLQGYNKIINGNNFNQFAYKESLRLNKLLSKGSTSKENNFNKEIASLSLKLTNMGVKNIEEDLEKYNIRDYLMRNRFDNYEENEALLIKALRLDPKYKEAYIYLAKIYKLQGRKCEEEMLTYKFNHIFNSYDEKIKFKNEISGINYKSINHEKELKEVFSNHDKLKNYVYDNLNLKQINFYNFDERPEGIHYDDDDKMDNMFRRSWKIARFQNDKILVKFTNFSDKLEISDANLFFSYLEVFSKVSHNEMSRIPIFRGVCWKEENIISIKNGKRYSYGLMFNYNNGITLRDYLRNERELSINRKMKIIIEICKIVEYLHQKKVISRCINPEEIHVDNDEEGRISLMNFKFATDKQKTRDLVDMSSLRYSAPEVIIQKSERINTNSNSDIFYEFTSMCDIWSIGVIMIEIFSGQIPFRDICPEEPSLLVLSFIDKQEIRLPENLVKEHIELVPVITKCLDYNPEKRYKIGELLNILREINKQQQL